MVVCSKRVPEALEGQQKAHAKKFQKYGNAQLVRTHENHSKSRILESQKPVFIQLNRDVKSYIHKAYLQLIVLLLCPVFFCLLI